MATDKNAFPVMSSFLRKCFRDHEAARIINIQPIREGKHWIVEGEKDEGDSHFSLRFTYKELMELFGEASGLPVLTAEMKKEHGDIPEPQYEPRPEPKAKPVTPPSPPEEKPTFTPPTQFAVSDRKSVRDPRGLELWDRFQRAHVKPHFGKRKLSTEQMADQDTWEQDNKIARSYLLAGEFGILQQWIDYLKPKIQ